MHSYKGNNLGKVVTCVQFLGELSIRYPSGPNPPEPAWRVHPEVIAWNGSLTSVVQDAYLRPLRDNPGQDETLTWRDVPTKETA